jgi:transketolase
MHTIKPLDDEAVRRAAEETGGIVTVEEHSIVGGLGGAVCESVCSLSSGACDPCRSGRRVRKVWQA